jgi:hypothetical protein
MCAATITCLIVAILSIYNQTSQKRQTQEQASVTQNKTQTEATDSLAAQTDTQNKNTDSTTNKTKSDPPDWLYRIYLVSGPIVVIVSIGTGFVVWRQVVALRQIERAWLMVDVDWLPVVQKEVCGEIVCGEPQEITANFRLTYRNCGQTPAWVIEKRVCYTTASPLPKRPDFRSPQMIERVLEPMSMRSVKTSDHSLTCDLAGEDSVVYGSVKYRDVFGSNRITTFGYINRYGKWVRIADPEKYNKHA